MPKHITLKLIADVVARWKAGQSKGAIAISCGKHRTTVRKILSIHCPESHQEGPASGERHWKWNGGRAQHPQRYVWIKIDRGHRFYKKMAVSNPGHTDYVLEHRLVMAEHLGRALRRHESVHHIDGDRANNVISNLELRTGQHGKGIRMRCLDCGSHNIASVPLGRTS